MSSNILRLDEINTLKSRVENADLQTEEEDIVDEILDFLLLAYADGKNQVEESLGFQYEPNADTIIDTVYRKIDGLTFEERVRNYIEAGDVVGIGKVIDTEHHRIFNESSYNTAIRGGATKKTWHTMEDERVRDSHFWLDGITKPINENYYTINGNEGLYPGQFGVPDEDINCRCYVTFSK